MGITREIIENNITNAEILEEIYHEDNESFSTIIKSMHDENKNDLAIQFWFVRLFYKERDLNKKDSFIHYIITLFLIIFCWIPIRLLTIPSFSNNEILARITPIILYFSVSLYFYIGTKNIINIIKSIIIHFFMLIFFIFLPKDNLSQSLSNSFYFSFIMLWFFNWFSFSSYRIKDKNKLNAFIQLTGETIIWSTLLILGGVVLSVLTIGLFEAIGIQAKEFYLKNIATFGICAAPFIAFNIIKAFDKLKLSIILATIFLPLFMVLIVTFCLISIFTDIKPYESRNIFIIYNLMLIIVIALLIFTNSNKANSRFIIICSNILTILTIILDGIVLSAIIFRLKTYGFTPNKITLLLTNIFMLGNLLYIVYLNIKNRKDTFNKKTIVDYLPLYFFLSITIVFIFPIVFHFT